jgi:hypothetical protein
MKKLRLLFAALGLLAGIAVIPAYAQKGAMKINVPFNFAMGDKTYPAGEYAFSSLKDSVILQNSGGARIAMVLANHTAAGSAGKLGKVIFACYAEEQCFVSQIWISGQDDGRELFRSRMETRAAAKQVERSIALLGTSSPQ